MLGGCSSSVTPGRSFTSVKSQGQYLVWLSLDPIHCNFAGDHKDTQVIHTHMGSFGAISQKPTWLLTNMKSGACPFLIWGRPKMPGNAEVSKTTKNKKAKGNWWSGGKSI